MKNKNNIGSKVAIGIISLVVLLMVCLSPKLIGKLIGNVNSINKNSGESINTGVVLNLNKLYNYEENNPIVMKIYNGSNAAITIDSIIYRNYCWSINECENFEVYDLDTPITVKIDEEKEYTINESINGFIDVGVQYSMTTLENGVEVTKIYNIFSSSINEYKYYALNGNSGYDMQAKEFIIRYDALNNLNGHTDDVYINLSDSNIYMDKSESLEDLNIYYSIKSGFGNKWTYEHPQNENSTTNKLMFNESNKSNIKKYFSYTAPNNSISGSGAFEYSDTNRFKLVGTPNSTYSNVDVVLGFYFRQYKDALFDKYDHWSDEAEPFSASEIPHFNLTVYDKSSLNSAIQNGFKKLNRLDEDVDQESWNSYLVKIYNALSLYSARKEYDYYSNLSDVMNSTNITKKEVNQSEINSMVNELNDTTIAQRSSANYREYDNLISTIQSKPEAWYTPESYAEFKTIYDERVNYENLTSAYQIKLNNYVNRLQTAFDKLIMYDADYSAVDAAITSANLITNKTEDGEYDLYTKESWSALQDAINSVDRSLKIKDQNIVDGYANAILNAQAGLIEEDAIYDELNDIITQYRNTEAYANDWYTNETKNPVEDYLKKITFDKKITEQSIVDTWVKELTPLVEALKKKKALGYLDSDNYTPFEGALSVEGYIKYLKELNRNIYTDETLILIDEIIKDSNDESFNFTIDKQNEMDEFLKCFDSLIKNQLQKKPGNYEELRKYHKIASELNTDYYEDVSELQKVLSKINWNYMIDEQEKVDAQTESLKKAINNLVMKLADYTEFNKAYEKAKTLNANYYVDFSKVQAAIENADNAMNLKIDKQSVVDDATDKLNNSISKLVLKDADYSKINVLKAIIEQLDENKYTNFDIVKEALSKIEFGKKANEQKLVDQMYNELKNAYDDLEKTRADYSELDKAVENAKKYESNKHNYTNYSVIETIINSINYNLSWEDQDKLDTLTKKINDAVENLNKKPANYSELSNILSKIENDYSAYDKLLQDEIKAFIEAVKSLPNNLKYDEQSKIDALVTKGKLLLEKLPVINVNNNGNNNNNSSNNITNDNEIILSYLKVNGNNVDISKTPFTYNVDYGVSEAKISVGLSSNTSTSKVYGGKALVPGNNNITIIVNTKEGKTYTYSLIINRNQYSNYLSDLAVRDSKIEFNKTKQEYNVKVDKNIDKLDLSAIAEDETAKVTIKGNKNIKNGSKVEIEVKSADGNVRVYTLNIQKASSVDVSIILILIMVLAIIVGIFRYIQEKRRLKSNT